MMMLFLIIQAIYMFLPAGLANMTPPLFKRVHFLDYPVDFGLRWRNRSLFGSHKTFRGFFFGIIVSIAVVFFQSILYMDYPFFRELSLIDYSVSGVLLPGFLLGFGALFGDLVESFLKRQVGVAPGKPWIPFDQIDFIIGALLLVNFVYIPSWYVWIILLIAIPAFHILFNHIGYYLGINKARW